MKKKWKSAFWLTEPHLPSGDPESVSAKPKFREYLARTSAFQISDFKHPNSRIHGFHSANGCARHGNIVCRIGDSNLYLCVAFHRCLWMVPGARGPGYSAKGRVSYGQVSAQSWIGGWMLPCIISIICHR